MRQTGETVLICPWKSPFFLIEDIFLQPKCAGQSNFLTSKIWGCGCPWIFLVFSSMAVSLSFSLSLPTYLYLSLLVLANSYFWSYVSFTNSSWLVSTFSVSPLVSVPPLPLNLLSNLEFLPVELRSRQPLGGGIKSEVKIPEHFT